jgi:hypothetical protein
MSSSSSKKARDFWWPSSSKPLSKPLEALLRKFKKSKKTSFNKTQEGSNHHKQAAGIGNNKTVKERRDDTIIGHTKKNNNNNHENKKKRENHHGTAHLMDRGVMHPLVKYLHDTGQKDVLARLGQGARDLHSETKDELRKIRNREAEETRIHDRIVENTTRFWRDVMKRTGYLNGEESRMPHLTLAYPILTNFHHVSPGIFTVKNVISVTEEDLKHSFFSKGGPSDLAYQMTRKVLARHGNTHDKKARDVDDMRVWEKLFPMPSDESFSSTQFEETFLKFLIHIGGGGDPDLAQTMESQVRDLRRDLKFIKKSIAEVRNHESGKQMVVQQGCVLYIASLILAWQFLALYQHIQRMEPSEVYKTVFVARDDPVLSQTYDVILEMYQDVSKYVLHGPSVYHQKMRPLPDKAPRRHDRQHLRNHEERLNFLRNVLHRNASEKEEYDALAYEHANMMRGLLHSNDHQFH